MQVLSRCPFGVASILWLPRSGAYTLTVACKATFRLAPELSPLADEQEPVTEGDVFWDDDENKSLDAATDLVPFKQHPEVLVVGHAYAPQGAPASSVIARLTVAEVDKAIEVTGDRHFKLDGSLSYPARFSRMPLRWERAAGGPETSNPAGIAMGDEARADAWGRVAVPNLLPAGRSVHDRQDVLAPACFAPIAPTWPSRQARLQRHAAAWRPHAWHARPLPDDLDAGYFNAAPADQRLHELTGSERITLENLHPQHALLSTRLARVAPRAQVDWGGGSTYDLALVCDTLLIDTDRGLATLTFRGHLSLDFPERSGWVIVTNDGAEPGRITDEATVDRIEKAEPIEKRALPAWLARVKDVHETIADPGDEPAAALPFTGEHPQALAMAQAGSNPGASFAQSLSMGPRTASNPGVLVAPFLEPDDDDGEIDDEDTYASVRGEPALPLEVPKGPRLGAFRLGATSERPAASTASSAPPPPPIPPPPPPAGLGVVSAAPVHLADPPAPPTFSRAPSPPMAPSGMPGFGPRGAPTFGFKRPITLTGTTSSPTAGAALPFVSSTPFVSAIPAAQASSPGMTIGERVAQARISTLDAPPSFAPESTQDIVLSDTPPPPPPRLGPLATPEMVAEDLGVAPSPEPEPAAEDAPATPPAEPEPPPPPALPLEEYPLDRCARIAASIARTRPRAREILDEHTLDDDLWDTLKAHWAAEIKAENERGKTALLRLYDAAYVAQLEQERGPIDVDQYARLVVASERGRGDPMLAELGLPSSAMLRIHRVWMQRMMKDAEVRTQVRRAVEAESDA